MRRYIKVQGNAKSFEPVVVCQNVNVDVSENSATPKSPILIGFSIINHPFWGTPIFGNTHVPVQEKSNAFALAVRCN